jgi:heme exporter protein D
MIATIQPGEFLGYVWAAYGITYAALLLYGVSLWMRWKGGSK